MNRLTCRDAEVVHGSVGRQGQLDNKFDAQLRLLAGHLALQFDDSFERALSTPFLVDLRLSTGRDAVGGEILDSLNGVLFPVHDVTSARMIRRRAAGLLRNE
jgi:hypothetical protein